MFRLLKLITVLRVCVYTHIMYTFFFLSLSLSLKLLF
jgi:hypothetical protein